MPQLSTGPQVVHNSRLVLSSLFQSVRRSHFPTKPLQELSPVPRKEGQTQVSPVERQLGIRPSHPQQGCHRGRGLHSRVPTLPLAVGSHVWTQCLFPHLLNKDDAPCPVSCAQRSGRNTHNGRAK